MRRKIAFVTRGGHPSKLKILDTLRSHFPGWQVDVIHVGDLIKKRRLVIVTNVLFVIREYGIQIVLGRKKLGECFWRTPYLFRQSKLLVSQLLQKGDYAFSFQYQSLIDGSRPGLPHYVYTDHTHLANLRNPYFKKTDLYSRRWIECERTIYRNATLVFTRTQFVSRSIIDDYGCHPGKAVCVYAGSNLEPRTETRGVRRLNEEILFVGFDWERKGGPELLRAFEEVKRVCPDARLTIVGCSPKVRVGNCEVVGPVSPERLGGYYERASLLCLPTRVEPSFPIVCLEAFAYGLPVVAANIEGMADCVIGDRTGYLVEPGDTRQLAKRLCELLQNPTKCRVLGENGRQLVVTRYNWDKVGDEIAKNVMSTIDQAGK